MDVMGCHAVRTSANLAAQGRFSEARTGAVASQRMMKRSLERLVVKWCSLGYCVESRALKCTHPSHFAVAYQ